MRVKRAAQETAKIQLSTDNPVFATYAIAAALAVLKIMGLGDRLPDDEKQFGPVQSRTFAARVVEQISQSRPTVGQ